MSTNEPTFARIENGVVVEIGPIAPAKTLAEKFHPSLQVIDITDMNPRPVLGAKVTETKITFTPPGKA